MLFLIAPAQAATPTDPNAGAAAGKIAFPPFDATTFFPQLFWLTLIFGLLYWLMANVALPRIAGILQARRVRIDGDLAQAARARAEAEAAAQAYDANLAKARAGAQATAQAARDDAASAFNARKASLEAELSAKLAEAEATIGRRKAEAMASVPAIAADAAEAIVERLTGRRADRAAIEAALGSRAPSQTAA